MFQWLAFQLNTKNGMRENVRSAYSNEFVFAFPTDREHLRFSAVRRCSCIGDLPKLQYTTAREGIGFVTGIRSEYLERTTPDAK